MSASDSVVSGNMSGPPAPAPAKRGRFAGERAGAWLFAASFSVGIWGLALKVLGPPHAHVQPVTAQQYALLTPSGAEDGHATVIWATEAVGALDGYPVVGGVPVIPLGVANGSPPAGVAGSN